MIKETSVMVTGLGGGGHGEQILKALRLSTLNLKIIGSDMSGFSKGIYEVDTGYIVPPASHPEYIPIILDIVRKHDIQALFHGSEPELKVLSANREIFAAQGVFLPINPPEVIDLCMDKNRTMQWLAQHGFHCPATTCIRNADDIQGLGNFPYILKPSVGGGGSANTFIVQDNEELAMLTRHLLYSCSEITMQEYVGTPEDEYTVGVLIDFSGQLINSIAVRRFIMSGLSNRIKVRNRTGRSDLGDVLAVSSGVSQGEIGSFPEITGICEKIALEMGCRGAVNIQCRVSGQQVYPFEINPRFSGTTSLRAMAGYNEPEVLLRRHLFNEDIVYRFSYRHGYILRGLEELWVGPEDIKRGLEHEQVLQPDGRTNSRPRLAGNSQ